MSDDVVKSNELVEAAAAPVPAVPGEGLSRKDRNAARRAEFEAQKATKDAKKAAAKTAELEERLATKEAKQEMLAAAKELKAAKKAAKAGKQENPEATDASAATSGRGKRKEKPVKPEKDPYRPRFAVAPPKVRAFTVVAALLTIVHVAAAVLLLLETTSSPVLGALPTDMPLLAYAGAAFAFVVAALWTFSATLLCTGRVSGKKLGVVALVLALPLSLIALPLLFSADVRDWAL